jgi:hypothetical protein
MHDTLHTRSARTIFSERESHDITTTEAHPPTSGWSDPSLFAYWCVPGCMEAFFEARSFGHDHKALGGDSFR